MIEWKSTGWQSFFKRIGRFGKHLVDRKTLERMGSFVALGLKKRTAKGVDFEDQRFVHYSAGYARYRAKKGRPTGKVNLFFKGRMLGAITHKVNLPRLTVRIFFADKQQALKAHGHYYGVPGRLPARKFFSPSKRDVNYLNKLVSKNIGG